MQDDGLHSNQTQYLVNLFKSCDLDNLKLLVTPMVPNKELHYEEATIDQAKEYIGSLVNYNILLLWDQTYNFNEHIVSIHDVT